MRKVSLLIFLNLFHLSCNHPEFKRYERNQGSNLDFPNNSPNDKYFNPSDTENRLKSNNNSKNVLKMEVQSGVRFVWIEINGIKLRFIFDTGASSISISLAVATVLLRQGTLKKEDFFDKQYYQDATGKISEGTRINLRTVQIGDRVLRNIEATVIDNFEAPLLLGQSVFEKFGKISIDNNRNEIIFE